MFSERFLQLYNDELRYFREAGRQFASSHPQVAQHLGMHIDGVLDPFVERLLEALLSLHPHSGKAEQRAARIRLANAFAPGALVVHAGSCDRHRRD